MPTQKQRLRLAILLALGFVLFRIGYALVFTGANSSGSGIGFSGIQLGGIFSHVTLFGPVSLVGIWNVVQSAIPFSAVILAIGVASSFFRFEKLIEFAAKRGSNLLSALVISIAILPSIAEAANRIRKALSFRGERRHKGAVPLLETALSRANLVGLRFSTRQPSASVQHPPIIVRNLSLDGVFENVNLEVARGEVVVISGPTGCGKTSLAQAMLGTLQVLSGRKVSGEITIFGSNQSGQLFDSIGYVPPDPREWFVSGLSSQEPGFGFLEWADIPEIEIANLSEGQAFLLSLQTALSRSPKILILDEPFQALDRESSRHLNSEIERLASQGVAFVIFEHRIASITANARYLVLDKQLSEGKFSYPNPEPRMSHIVQDVLVRYQVPKIRDLLLPSEVELSRSQVTVMQGPNGSGKTSLLEQMNKDIPDSKLVPERVQDFFVTQSLAQELTRADRIAKVPNGLTELTLRSLIDLPDSLMNLHPRDLSSGTQLALAIAMQLSYKPKVLLIDEPARGLDPVIQINTAEVLSCVAETGCSVVLATHHENFIPADQVIEIGVGSAK